MDKFPLIGGTGITPESLKMSVMLDIRYNLAKPLLSGKTIIIVKYYYGFPIYVHYYNLGRKWRNI